MGWQRTLWSLSISCFISSVSYTMLVPFLPLYLFDLGVTDREIHVWTGLIFSATFLVSALMCPYWGRLADKHGKRRMLIRAGASLATVYFFGSLVTSPLQLLVVRLLQGVATGFMPAALAIVASTAAEDKMGLSLGFIQTATLAGGIAGPLFGGVLSHLFGIRMSFVVAAVVMFLGTIAVRILVAEPPRDEAPQTSGVVSDLRIALSNRILVAMLAVLLLAQAAVMVLQPLVTLYVAELQGGLDGAVLKSGIVFSLAGAGALAAPMWGRVGQTVGFFKILVTVFVGAGIANACQFFVRDIWSFGLLQGVFGFFIAGVYPVINTIIVENTDPSFRGRAFGLMMSANQFGSMIGPLFGGIVSAWLGIKLVLVWTGISLIAVGFIIWTRREIA